MADDTNDSEHRAHPRHQIKKLVRARAGDRQGEGHTRDISASGAALDIDLEVEVDEKLELDIEDVGFLASEMARNLDDGFAVRFIDLDDEEEEFLIAELSGMKSSTDFDDT